MTKPAIGAAILAAQRFMKLARELEATSRGEASYLWPGTKLSGATRRASMDLTRALADLRRPK